MKTFDVNEIQLKIQSPGITLDQAMESHLIEQIEKIGQTYSRITGCEMLLRTEKNDKGQNCFIEAKIFIPGHMLFSKQHAENFQIASSKLFDDLRDQLVRIKEKMQNKSSDGIDGIESGESFS